MENSSQNSVYVSQVVRRVRCDWSAVRRLRGSTRRPANPYGFAVLFYGETDNLRIYGQVKIITVKPDLPSMVFSLLCLTKLSSSVTIIWAVVGLPVGDIYICACICSCFPLRKCSKTKKRRTREIAYKYF